MISANSDEEDKQNLSIGLQIGLINKSFNTENFLYENQYSPTSENGFNKNIPSGEYITKQSYLKLNANVGIYYRKKFSNEKLTF